MPLYVVLIWASALTLTEELFTGDVELLSDRHIRPIQNVFIYFLNLCFALFNNSEWILIYSQVKATAVVVCWHLRVVLFGIVAWLAYLFENENAKVPQCLLLHRVHKLWIMKIKHLSKYLVWIHLEKSLQKI